MDLECIGPNNYRPGQAIDPKIYGNDLTCSKHPKSAGYKIVIGESDSMGSEVTVMCRNCYGRHLHYMANRTEDEMPHCERCDSIDGVQGVRDPDEGFGGPVYMWCRGCAKSFWDEWHRNNPPDEEDNYSKPESYREDDDWRHDPEDLYDYDTDPA